MLAHRQKPRSDTAAPRRTAAGRVPRRAGRPSPGPMGAAAPRWTLQKCLLARARAVARRVTTTPAASAGQGEECRLGRFGSPESMAAGPGEVNTGRMWRQNTRNVTQPRAGRALRPDRAQLWRGCGYRPVVVASTERPFETSSFAAEVHTVDDSSHNKRSSFVTAADKNISRSIRVRINT